MSFLRSSGPFRAAGNLKEWLAKLRSTHAWRAGDYCSMLFPLIERNYPQITPSAWRHSGPLDS